MLSKIFGTIFFLALLGIILVVFQAGATSAGQVIFSQDYRVPGASQVLTFNNPATLKVFQANLQPGRPDYYAFQGIKDSIVTIKLDTLRLVGQDTFVPSLALFGPGLPPLTPDEQPLFPYSLPAGYGLLLSAESTPISQTTPAANLPGRFDEPWTQSGYWERQSLLNQLPQGGTYYLAVYSLNEQSGKYALFIGDKPEAGLRETLTFPVTWARLHYWFEDLWWPAFALGVVGLAVLTLLYLSGRSLGRNFFRPLAYARRNRRRTALLAGKKRHGWKERRINRAPLHKPGSSNVIIARLLAQTAGRASTSPNPAVIPERPLPNGTTSEPLPAQASLINWEDRGQEKAPVNPLPGPTTPNGIETEPATRSYADGLSAWSKRFRP